MGNMGTAEAEGQATEVCEWELRGTDGGGRRGEWARDKSGRRSGNVAVVLPQPWLFGQGMDTFSLVQWTKNALSSLVVK